jgi:hypothetical protein
VIPERTFSSADELRAHYRAVRARLFPQAVVARPTLVLASEPPQPTPEPGPPEPASERTVAERLSVRAIIDRVAAEHKVGTKDILGPSRRSHVVAARWQAIAAVHKAFPTKGMPWLGEKFGLDHTSALNALQKLGLRAHRPDLVGARPTIPPMPDEQFEMAVRLYQTGLSQKRVAAHFGVPESRIYKLFKERGVKVCRVVTGPS